MGFNTLVLSLPSDEARRRQSREILDRYGLEFRFFDAVNGASLSDEARNFHYDAVANVRGFKRPLSNGEIACYLGHLQMWRHIASCGANAALILEDDFRFLREPCEFLRALAKFDLSDVIVKLDASAPQGAYRFQKIKENWLMQSRLLPPRTTGYVVGARAAARMLGLRSHFFRPVDIDLKHHWEHGVPIFVTEHALIGERDAGESRLAAGRTGAKPSMTMRFWCNLKYQFAFRWAMHTADRQDVRRDSHQATRRLVHLP
ncbi:glycosyltransferase family 25 protein [Ciceribacter sp. RN22]|uniref:glycosyltransferase family 25 protein n=1 Tax=Ciceribacter sp. RN22 TaxID=2954932 RepID=UPI002093072E|nr:glycosyltransferase family 25 protein [Ciceribacter sp. RN22]MCO6180920.1 glycosyltransferase family 25 protein [Ciceribacter sp. RN22]